MPISNENLIRVINANRDKKLAASRLIETNPASLPVMTKLVSDATLARNVENDDVQINRAQLESISARIANVKENNKYVIQLFPDIELAIQILVSSILSPKTMTVIQLNYRLNKNFTIDPSVSAKILEAVKNYIADEYNYEEILPEIVREALFVSGSAIYAVIPEASVDAIINADLTPMLSMESYKDRIDMAMNTLTAPKQLINSAIHTAKFEENMSLESFVENLAKQSAALITDNPGILTYAKLKERVVSSIVKHHTKRGESITMESADKVNYLDVFRKKNNVTDGRQVISVPTRDESIRKSIGKPMMVKFPSEAVITLFTPGNEKDHRGYLILLDEAGKPLSAVNSQENLQRLSTSLGEQSGNMTPIQKAYNNLINSTNTRVDLNALFDMYKGILERQLFTSVRSSLYGENVSISNQNDIFFMMFSRALQSQRTSILFLPKELVTYFAFQYNEIGIGKSLLENLSIQSSMRAILLFSKVMAQAKQSIDVTKVNVSLDPRDPDPEKTIDQIQASVLKLRQNNLPIGLNNPTDLLTWIHRAGLMFSYENHPGLPNVAMSFENANTPHTIPDSNLDEDLRKQSIIALGLQPETIDNSFSPEFAKTVVANNVLLSKRISIYQRALMTSLSHLTATIIYNDYNLRGEIEKHVLESLDDIQKTLTEDEKQLLVADKSAFVSYCIDKISEHIEIELPKPEETDINNLSLEYELYKTNLDAVIDSIISSEILGEDVAGDTANHVDTVRNVWKHALLRKWMADNNYYPEVLEFTRTEEKEIDMTLEVITDDLAAVIRNSNKILRNMRDIRKAADKDLENTFEGQELEAAGTSSEGGSESNAASDEGEGEEDIFGGVDDDASGDDLLNL